MATNISNTVTRQMLINALGGPSASKPKTITDWEARFTSWQKPSSETEDKKIDTAKERVLSALNNNEFLKAHSWDVISQGSYHNNTNVRQNSDVDLAVRLNDVYYFDGPPPGSMTAFDAGLYPLAFTFSDYRTSLLESMEKEFGKSTVDGGNNAIHLNEDDKSKVSVDLVPTFTYRIYGSRPYPSWPAPVLHEGIAFLTLNGERKTNFPEPHYSRGCIKNTNTGRRYKRVVRILKRIKYDIVAHEANSNMVAIAKTTSSYLIENLVYNCPDNLFNNRAIYMDVKNVLDHLQKVLVNTGACATLLGTEEYNYWFEVNGIKPLFGYQQKWTPVQARGFVLAAQIYLGT